MRLIHSAARRSRVRRPRGISLVEMMVVMTIAAAMMGLAVTTMHLLLRAEHEATKAVRYSTSVARLSRAFRDDVHAARNVDLPMAEPGQPAALLATVEGGARIRYELDAHRATRIETKEAEETQRETFHFPPRSRLHFDRVEDLGLVRLTVEMPVGVPRHGESPVVSSAEPVQRLAIEAAPARIRRLKMNATTGGVQKDDNSNRQEPEEPDQEKPEEG